jgi:hypothetical protein
MPTKRINLPERPKNYPAVTNWDCDRFNYRSGSGKFKGKPYIEVQLQAFLPVGFNATKDLGGFDELQASMLVVANNVVDIMNRTARADETDSEAILRMIIQSLPKNKDWLDPDLERAAKKLLGLK